MLLRVHDLVLDPDEDGSSLGERACERLGLPGSALRSYRILRRSVDARRARVRLLYALEVEVEGVRAEGLGEPGGAAVDEGLRLPPHGHEPMGAPPVVVGAGPAGMLAAWLLAREGYRPLLLERGLPVERRSRSLGRFFSRRELDPESNLLFGEGGAGTYSDGKVNTGSRDPRVALVYRILVEHGAPERILYDARPHIGTDRLKRVVKALRSGIETAGGELRFGCRVDSFETDRGRLSALRTSGGRVECRVAIVATGHSGRDTYEALRAAGARLVPRPFQMGLRIEHPQTMLDRCQYGRRAGHPALGAASYRLVARGSRGGPDVYTFCMCPGGVILPTPSEPGGLVTNGMSASTRNTRYGNSALVATVGPEDFGSDSPLAGVAFQRHWERAGFLAGGGTSAPRPSSPRTSWRAAVRVDCPPAPTSWDSGRRTWRPWSPRGSRGPLAAP
ncbi:MAG: NAD(P)-binding protein [Planctomycetes bacterium]|nr:NAD(P)-binding protein [Planctomycetota bacterium]